MNPTETLLATADLRLLKNYRPAPVVMRRGKGCELWDSEGRRYLDMTAGIAVCALGHGDPGLAAALSEQALQLVHTSNLYFIETQLRFAEALASRPFAGRAFFCNSGSEANEAGLKLARRYQQVVKAQPERTEVIAFTDSFHGRTVGSLSVTGQKKYREGFAPLVPGVSFAEFGNLDSVAALIGDKTAAVIVEPIQAEGGIRVAPRGFLRALLALCRQHGVLLIFDEVQTGVGRTGTFYAFEQEDVVPDILTLAKGIAGGVPMGVMLASDTVSSGFEPGTHASTFGGNPLACAAALYVSNTIDKLGLLKNCGEQGAYLSTKLTELAARHGGTPRGRGLLQGLHVREGLDAAAIVGKAREKGLLLSVAGGSVVRFVPPLIVTSALIDEAIAILDGVLSGSGST
ncbi:MAG: aspartate aminotransferase family protein [Deltaproteobacteria bacterium]|nr:aspartate aminotransferase family protein [Deltaproteobacteria bacterium]